MSCSPVVLQALETMDSIARLCMGALAQGVSLPQDAFLPLLESTPASTASGSVLEVVKYKAVSQGGCDAHEDQGLLTVIFSPDSRALQVLKTACHIKAMYM